MDVVELRALVLQRQKRYVRSLHSGFGDAKDIVEALDIFEEFYILSGIEDGPWSENANVKCECSNCRKDGLCHHSAAISLLCNNEVVMPPEYYMHGIPMKQKRGRPSAVKDKKAEEELPEVPRKKPQVCLNYYSCI
jgi:hypothetical protein